MNPVSVQDNSCVCRVQCNLYVCSITLPCHLSLTNTAVFLLSLTPTCPVVLQCHVAVSGSHVSCVPVMFLSCLTFLSCVLWPVSLCVQHRGSTHCSCNVPSTCVMLSWLALCPRVAFTCLCSLPETCTLLVFACILNCFKVTLEVDAKTY